MMSAADFPDVFPWMREIDTCGKADRSSKKSIRTPWAYDECIARWEDDDGRVLKDSPSRTSPITESAPSKRMDPVMAYFLFPILPALLFCRATVAILSAAQIVIAGNAIATGRPDRRQSALAR